MWWGAMHYTFHTSPPQLNNISHQPHFWHSTPYHISHHSTSHSVQYHQIDVDSVVWNLVWCGMFCNAKCGICALFILMWLRCRIRCDTEYVHYGVMLNVMSCKVRRGAKYGDVMWNDGVVHGEYGGMPLCKMWNVVVEYRVMWNGLTPY